MKSEHQTILPIAPNQLSQTILSISDPNELNEWVQYYQMRHLAARGQKLRRGKAEHLLAIDAGLRNFDELKAVITNERYFSASNNASNVIEKTFLNWPAVKQLGSRRRYNDYEAHWIPFASLIVKVGNDHVAVPLNLVICSRYSLIKGFQITARSQLYVGTINHALLASHGEIDLQRSTYRALTDLIPLCSLDWKIDSLNEQYEMCESFDNPPTAYQRRILRNTLRISKFSITSQEALTYLETKEKPQLERLLELQSHQHNMTLVSAALATQYRRGIVQQDVVYDKEITSVKELIDEMDLVYETFSALCKQRCVPTDKFHKSKA